MQDAVPREAFVASRPLTSEFARFLKSLRPQDIPDRVRTWGRHAVLDWTGVALAARDEDCVRILVDELVTDAGQSAGGTATVLGHGRRARLLDAALINGTASHALDYDDVNPYLGGHPSVVTIPVALAIAEETGANGLDVLTAIIAGFEVGCAIGNMTSQSHYAQGFHNTGTIGTFAAAATAAYLMRLDETTTRIALSLAASQAAGLKCNFGTMTKPFHAGAAAMNGLRAARLAARGFTASENAIEAHQGFATSQIPVFDPMAWTSPLEQSAEPDARAFGIERTLFKYHAACYGTHGLLEACHDIRRRHGPRLEDIDAIDLYVPVRSKGQCDIAEPDSGLTMKFSSQHLAVSALAGLDTAAISSFSAENAGDARLAPVRRKVRMHFEPERDRYITDVRVHMGDGRVLEAQANVGIPASDLDAQWEKLARKFDAISAPVIGAERTAAARTAISGMNEAASVSAFVEAVA